MKWSTRDEEGRCVYGLVINQEYEQPKIQPTISIAVWSLQLYRQAVRLKGQYTSFWKRQKINHFTSLSLTADHDINTKMCIYIQFLVVNFISMNINFKNGFVCFWIMLTHTGSYLARELRVNEKNVSFDIWNKDFLSSLNWKNWDGFKIL